MNDFLVPKIDEEYNELMDGYEYSNKSDFISTEWKTNDGVFTKFSIYDESKCNSISTTLSGLNSF